VEEISTFQNKSDEFLQRNFTAKELKYCMSRPNPAASLAGRWCAKEAVIKALTMSVEDREQTEGEGDSTAPKPAPIWKASSAPLIGIEILASNQGRPVVVLHDHAEHVAARAGHPTISVSITHTQTHAAAVANAN
jgi:phosphopantetheine--protein transferase-like protein